MIVGTWVFDCKPCGKDSTPESRVKKHKIGRWLSSTDSRGEYFVRVGTRTSLRVDPFANIVARGVYLVSFDVSKGSMTLRTFRTLNLWPTRDDGYVVWIPEVNTS